MKDYYINYFGDWDTARPLIMAERLDDRFWDAIRRLDDSIDVFARDLVDLNGEFVRCRERCRKK